MVSQSGVQRLDEVGGAVAELDLDLPPAGRRAGHLVGAVAEVQPLSGDPVVGHLDEHVTGRVAQSPQGPFGRDVRDRLQWAPESPRPHHRLQLVGDGARGASGRYPARGQPDLRPGRGARGELEVPARVLAAGAPAQRQPCRGEAQVSGVEVDGFQPVLGRHPVRQR